VSLWRGKHGICRRISICAKERADGNVQQEPACAACTGKVRWYPMARIKENKRYPCKPMCFATKACRGGGFLKTGSRISDGLVWGMARICFCGGFQVGIERKKCWGK